MAAKFTKLGMQKMMEYYFKAGTAPTSFAIGLSGTAFTQDSTVASGEPSGNGYAQISLTRDATGFPDSAYVTDGWEVGIQHDRVFTASGGAWSACVNMFMVDNAGNLICWWDLAATRTLQNGDSDTVNATIRLQANS